MNRLLHKLRTIFTRRQPQPDPAAQGLCMSMRLRMKEEEAQDLAVGHIEGTDPVSSELYWIPMDAPDHLQVALSVRRKPKDEADHRGLLASILFNLGMELAQEIGANDVRDLFLLHIPDENVKWLDLDSEDEDENADMLMETAIWNSDHMIMWAVSDFKDWRQDKELQECCRESTFDGRLCMITNPEYG